MREFFIKDLERALGGKAMGMSVRKTGKYLDIPKSTIGRWFKDPDYYRQSMEFKYVGREMKEHPEHMIKKPTKYGPRSNYDKFRRYKEKILKNPVGRQRELSVSYDDETGRWTVAS